MKSISKGDNYGTTVHTSNPAVDFPRANSSSGYGKKKPFVKPHGGDQYGTTMHKSAPAIDFPTKPSFAASKKSGPVDIANNSPAAYTQPTPSDSHS